MDVKATMHRREGGWLKRCAVAAAILLALSAAVPGAQAGQGGQVKADDAGASYLYGLAHSGFNSAEATITPGSVANMQQRLALKAPDTLSAQPIVSGGVLYWSSWDGYQHASRAGDGGLLWQTYLGQETKSDCSPPHLGVASTPALVPVTVRGTTTNTLFVGGGDGTFYALNAATGAILWRTPFGSPQDGYFLWSSPAVFDGSVYMGVASIGDCPLVQGRVVKMDAATGAVQATFQVVPTGCTGGGVWSSVTVDTQDGTLYVSTGTPGSCSTPNATGEQYAAAVLELRAGDLSLIGAWKHGRARGSGGSWAPPPSQQISDGDFGATPTLFTATINGLPHRMVGLANKNGIYYAFDRNNLSAGPVWETGPLTTNGDAFASSAWDGTHLYVAVHDTTINGVACTDAAGSQYNAGVLSALDPATGRPVWQTCLPGGPPEAAVTAVAGLALVSFGSVLYAVDTVAGRVRWQFQDNSFNWFFTPPTVSNGVLYAGNSDGTLFSFAP